MEGHHRFPAVCRWEPQGTPVVPLVWDWMDKRVGTLVESVRGLDTAVVAEGYMVVVMVDCWGFLTIPP